MKLPEGKTVYIGRRKFIGEIPDDLAPKNLKATDTKKAKVEKLRESTEEK